MFGISLFLIRLVIYISNYGFKKSRNIRKFLLGRDFIEGYWIDIVRLNDQSIREYAVIEIEYVKEELEITGTIYNKSFERIGKFESGVSKYRKRKLEYGYSRKADHERTEQASGLGKYEFIKNKPFPLTFVGSFFDSEVDHRVNLEGVKINSERHIKLLSTKNIQDEVTVLKEQVNRHFKK